MLSTQNLSVRLNQAAPPILDRVSVDFLPGKLNAVVGPSGCGKTTLIRALVGWVPFSGDVLCRGRPAGKTGSLRGRVGYVPQFCVAHRSLTVRESLRDALDLHVSDPAVRENRLRFILQSTGLEPLSSQRVGSLSGGQLRRLALALEMSPEPEVFLCDEVTTGLDPGAENRILNLLEELRDRHGKTFVNVIHNLRQLHRFDRIVVLDRGRQLFQGSFPEFLRFFQIEDPEELHARIGAASPPHPENPTGLPEDLEPERRAYPPPTTPPCPPPGAWSQVLTLVRRRFRLFWRDRGYLFLTAAITIGFPLMVVVFALGGLPQIERLSLEVDRGLFEGMAARFEYLRGTMETGSLVSGLIMFQVILLTLMGSNNGAREIASERGLYEQERLRGLSSGAYATSKLIFGVSLACVQGCYMAFFVKAVCGFPGPLSGQMLLLVLVTAAMTVVSLGFSAVSRTAERASLLSIYLVGFQLPLSGVVLALPESLVWVTRPLISAYWGWAGYLSTFRDNRLYDSVVLVVEERIPSLSIAVLFLFLHLLLGAVLVLLGSRKVALPAAS